MNFISYDKIRGLVNTEKSNNQLQLSKYCFEVSADVNKSQIKIFVNKNFGVEVVKVNVIKVFGKIKKFKGLIGRRSSYKKILVTVKKGQLINVEGLK
jgi:large subunit ribosomal protein L23